MLTLKSTALEKKIGAEAYVGGHRLKPPRAKAASFIVVPVGIPAAPLQIHLPSNAPGKSSK